ncbi:hypothetical protein MPCS_01910 (plasmid) [Candidatus Megaera polyxenophila]|nr:hypothetical protein MPCS_01910 [Candidatus Megaera polyxenophila]
MGCMINIINFLDKYNGLIMCFLTFGIMIFAAVTAKIANQKRKDDLFKIRWKIYEEIVIKFKEKYLEATKQHSIEEELYYQMEESEFLGNTGLSKKQYKEIINNNLISKIRWLFDDEIADLIKNLLINDYNGTQKLDC